MSWPDVPPAVVVGLDCITGLQTARILAHRGVPVSGVTGDQRHWATRTNACVEIVVSPLSGEHLVGTLADLGRRLDRRGVLLPCTDAAVDTVSRHRDRLAEWYALPLAPHPIVELLMDKVSFSRHATAHELPVPRTELLTSVADADLVAPTLTYPCIVKPPVKSAGWQARTSAKGFAVRDAGELLSEYHRVRSWTPTLLVQEWVTGPEEGLFSCNAYFDREGEPLVTFVARKLRQWPPDIGTSASGEECRNDEVLDCTLRVFQGVGFHGLAYLEMKRDARTGRLLVIEPNVGRPTGRSAIAEAGGVELVYTAYADAAGLPLPAARQQRYVGAKWVDLRRDLQAAAVARRTGEFSSVEWLRWMRGPKAHAIWSRRDPLPFAADLAQATASGVRMVRRRSRTRAEARRGRFSPPAGRRRGSHVGRPAVNLRRGG